METLDLIRTTLLLVAFSNFPGDWSVSRGKAGKIASCHFVKLDLLPSADPVQQLTAVHQPQSSNSVTVNNNVKGGVTVSSVVE